MTFSQDTILGVLLAASLAFILTWLAVFLFRLIRAPLALRIEELENFQPEKLHRDVWIRNALIYIATGAWTEQQMDAEEKFTRLGNACGVIRQAVIDHGLPIWGKLRPHDNVWQPIPEKHWSDNQIKLDTLFIGNPEDVRTEASRRIDVPTWYALMTSRKKNRGTMAQGKYLSLEEARKIGKLKEFAKQHPSKADCIRFERLLDAMIRSSPEAI